MRLAAAVGSFVTECLPSFRGGKWELMQAHVKQVM